MADEDEVVDAPDAESSEPATEAQVVIGEEALHGDPAADDDDDERGPLLVEGAPPQLQPGETFVYRPATQDEIEMANRSVRGEVSLYYRGCAAQVTVDGETGLRVLRSVKKRTHRFEDRIGPKARADRVWFVMDPDPVLAVWIPDSEVPDPRLSFDPPPSVGE